MCPLLVGSTRPAQKSPDLKEKWLLDKIGHQVGKRNICKSIKCERKMNMVYSPCVKNTAAIYYKSLKTEREMAI